MAERCAGWTDKDGERVPCQFGDPVPHTHFGSNIYCDYHLLMGETGVGGKANWDEERRDAFTTGLINRIKAESKAELEKPEEQRGRLNFQGVVVPGEFLLNGETICTLHMHSAQFHGDAWFNEAQFHGDVLFNKAQFHGQAVFDKAQFHGDAVFNEAQFGLDAWFNKARFHVDAAFNEVQFHRRARFDGVQFNRNAWFNEAQFHWFAMFGKAQFHGSAEFNGSADPARLEARQFNYFYFRRARFKAGANFSNREFRDRTDFSGCVFEIAPNFHGSILHQDTAFGGTECFPDVTSRGADHAYRTLRQAMEGHRARAEEGMFYMLEQKARRHGMSFFDPAFWLSLCYGLGSNYGFSVVRPLGYFFGGIIASAFLLLCVGVFGGEGGANWAAIWNDGLLFSGRQTFQPFDALRSGDEILKAYSFNPGGTGWLRAWGVGLTLFEALAGLLLVLAVRWRYRR